MYLLEFLKNYKELDLFYFFPFIFTFNSGESSVNLIFKEHIVPKYLTCLIKINDNIHTKKYSKLYSKSICILPFSGLVLLDEFLYNIEEIKNSTNLTILNTYHSFIETLNKYFENKISIEDNEYKFYLNSVRNLNKITHNIIDEKISVILAVYNSEKTIRNSINSILSQTYKNIELVIVNDGSTDKTKQIIEEYNEYKNVKIINLDKNNGVYFARNRGIIESTGDYITFQDADDVSMPYRIENSYIFYKTRKPSILLTRINNIHHPEKPLLGMVTAFFSKEIFNKNGKYDYTTRHSGDIEYIDRLYFNEYKEFKNVDIWLWLNSLISYDNFCYVIPDVLYKIKAYDDKNISSQYKKEIRNKYLKMRRENKFLDKY